MDNKVDDKLWLENVKSGNRAFLNNLYTQYRNQFIKWAKWKYQIDEDDAAEVYQKAFTIFYFNIKNEKIDSLSSSIETYLYGIAKNLLYNFKKDRAQNYVSLNDINNKAGESLDLNLFYEASHNQLLVKKILEKIGDPCKKLLRLFYFENYSMESIADELGYKTSMVAKKKKFECLSKIRKELNILKK